MSEEKKTGKESLQEILDKLPKDAESKSQTIALLAGITGSYVNIAERLLKNAEDIVNSESNDKYDDILLLLKDHERRARSMSSLFATLLVKDIVETLERTDESTNN